MSSNDFDTLKHHFIDCNKVVFYEVQKADCEFSGPIAYLKHLLSNFVRVGFFDSLDAEKEFA
jgi:hypothetical protein